MWCALGSISFCRGLDQRGCGCVVDSDAGTCAAAIKSRACRVRFDHGCTYCLFRICTHIHTYVALEPQFMVGTMVERLSCDYLSYKMDYTGSQMMITIKLTSFAWFYTDGSSNPEAMKKELAEMKASLRVRAKLNTDADKRIARTLKSKIKKYESRYDTMPNPLTFMAWTYVRVDSVSILSLIHMFT